MKKEEGLGLNLKIILLHIKLLQNIMIHQITTKIFKMLLQLRVPNKRLHNKNKEKDFKDSKINRKTSHNKTMVLKIITMNQKLIAVKMKVEIMSKMMMKFMNQVMTAVSLLLMT